MNPSEAEGPSAKRDITYEILEERISYLELLKSFHDEILKIIRIYTSTDHFTSQRCLQEIVNFIQRRFDLYLVDIFLHDGISDELILYVAAGDASTNPWVKSLRVKLDEGLCGHCARTGETIVARDVRKDARYIRTSFRDTRAELVVPIRIKNRVVGVLDLQDRSMGRFKKDFVTLMEDLAVNVGFVLENKRLYDDLKHYSGHLEKKVDDKVLELQRSEERYRTIVENSSNLILTSDESGNITWANRSALNVLGYDRIELEGLNVSRIVRKGHMHKLYTVFKDLSESRDPKAMVLEIVTKNNETRVVEITCAPLREKGLFVGAELSMLDVTDRTVIEKLKKNYMKTLEEEVVQRTTEIKDTQRAAILAIASLAESIDYDTEGHIQRIRLYCRVLAEELRDNPKYREEITDDYIDLLFDLSPLHDLGKVGIRDYILQKRGKLTDQEFSKMKEHTVIGARALRMAGEMIHRDSIFAIAEMIARFHHERWDGRGYPEVEIDGEARPLRGEEIPLCARIVALADVYDALTSKRPYKAPYPHDRARDMIVEQKGKHFDPSVVEAFLSREEDFIQIRRRFPE
ncbi:MAG: HD domain-containing phosphohydrolase, partial [Planctomycetota bacterium]